MPVRQNCHPERSETPSGPSGHLPREAAEGWGGGLAALGMTPSVEQR